MNGENRMNGTNGCNGSVDEDKKFEVIDTKAPFNVSLSAKYKRFALQCLLIIYFIHVNVFVERDINDIPSACKYSNSFFTLFFLLFFFNRTFAYYTIQHRLPIILTKIIDSITRDRDELASIFDGEVILNIIYL